MSFSSSDLLRVEGLEKRFGGIVALADYAVNLKKGELLALIGPNGAGKTTVFNLLSGVLKPTAGRILFDGIDITKSRPDQCAVVGISRTFQNIRLFNDLTVLENINVAFHMHLGTGFWRTVFHTPRHLHSEKEMNRRADEFLDLMDLQAVRNELASSLPYGVQRRVEIARALAAQPKLLLLDEPAAGMNPQETAELVHTINAIHKEYHLTIFLVEHDMKMVMNLCERIQVLDRGRVLAEGTPVEIQNDQRVIEAYLGGSKEQCVA